MATDPDSSNSAIQFAMLLQFFAGLSLLISLGVALQLRLTPAPVTVKALGWIAATLALAAVILVLTETAPGWTWALLAGWFAAQVGTQAARRAWLRKAWQNH